MAVAAAAIAAAHGQKPGDAVAGFTVKEARELPELRARMVRMEHAKSGADLVWLDRPDETMTFSIGFRTLPEDDTGVAHILEHSVLCGSEKYPVKEPFVELLKSSFAKFLNAWTSADATMYPVCTCNRADLLNLMDVYLDAVFNPLSVRDPHAFGQEGWHWELESAEGELKRNGVVYSEMKGAFANPDRRMGHELRRLLYPDTCYGKVSGGDPEAIPQLTFESYKAFYRRFYHPSNARIFLDGKVDLPAALAKLDSFLAKYGRAECAAEVKFQTPVAGTSEGEYEIDAGTDPEGKVLVGDAWVFGKYGEREKFMAMDAITTALAGGNDAPLMKALLGRGLCGDLRFGVSGAAQLEVSVVAKNVKEKDVAEVRRVVRETLEAAVRDGIDRERLAAILDRAEFHDREKDYGGFPRGLAFMLDANGTWLYGGDPADAFSNGSRFAFLRGKIGTGWFERVLKEAVLENPHHAEATLRPSAELGAKRRRAEKEELAKIKASWSAEKIAAVVKECRERAARQAAPDPKEALAKLPRLSLKDIPLRGPELPREITERGGVTVVRPATQANGVFHAGLYFSCADFTDEELKDLPLLESVLAELPTANFAIGKLRNEIDGKLGRFSPSVDVFAPRGKAPDPCFSVWVSALESRAEDAVRLVGEILLGTDYSDAKAVGEIVRQLKIAGERSVAGIGGRNYAFRRAAAQLSSGGAAEELVAGFAQLAHVRKTAAAFGSGAGAEKCAALKALAAKVFTRARLTVCVSDNMPAEFADRLAGAFPAGAKGAPAARAPFPKMAEGFRIPAEIGFAAKVARPAEYPYTGQAAVACRILALGQLWREIRVKGGAYGGNVSVKQSGVAGWLSWNDPKPARSLGVYAESAAELRKFAEGGEPLESFIIGAVGGSEPYLTPSVETAIAVEAHLSGRTPEDRQRRRAEMLGTGKGDLLKFADALEGMAKDPAVCVLGGAKQLEACGGALEKIEAAVGE